jgi:hypothetical protein
MENIENISILAEDGAFRSFSDPRFGAERRRQRPQAPRPARLSFPCRARHLPQSTRQRPRHSPWCTVRVTRGDPVVSGQRPLAGSGAPDASSASFEAPYA